MPAPDSTEARLAARREAAKAARAAAPTWGPVETIAMAELRPGDFVVAVPTQQGTRGVRYESQATDVCSVQAGTQLLPSGLKVHTSRDGIAVACGGRAVGLGALVWPYHFDVQVRRVAQ